LVRLLGLSRSRIYFKSKIKERDDAFLIEIKAAMRENPAYGSPRISIALTANHKRVERVMKNNKLKALRRRQKHFKPDDVKQPPAHYPNLLKNLCAISPRTAYATDFTYINFHGSFIYVATVIDIFSREILGWDISTRHTAVMMKRSLEMAFQKGVPAIMHSDQGSEMKSEVYTVYAETSGAKISMSSKASPWQNGYQESFYNGFKLDLGDPNRFETLGELIEAINQTISYYNRRRIHTALRTSPNQYYEQYKTDQSKLLMLVG
jgi:transposase InsO family protein